MTETKEVTYTIKNVSKTDLMSFMPNCSFNAPAEKVLNAIDSADLARLDNGVLYLSYYCADDNGKLVIEDYTIECNEGRIPDIVQHNRRLSGGVHGTSPHKFIIDGHGLVPSLTVGR